MNKLEHQLLRDEVASAGPLLWVRSATRIDTGLWWRHSPVWICVAADELVVLAVGRRGYFERIAIAECRASNYNPATGELVIEPVEALQHSRLKFSSRDALRILSFLKIEN